MVRLNKIYTRTGDKGTTGLSTGARIEKSHRRIIAFGTVDETNAHIGVARSELLPGDAPELDAMLARIQNDLFDLGADLATPDHGEELEFEPLRIIQTQVDRLEKEIDHLNQNLAPLRSFVLPGGGRAAAALHVARTVARRAECQMVALVGQDGEHVGQPALAYINRLSDFLFVASRHVNDNGAGDVLWVPGENR